MARTMLFVQGGGEGAHDDWDVRLADNLKRVLGDGYDVLYPRMPDEADPAYATWAAALRRVFVTLPDGAILLGHSIGATILISALAEQAPPFKLGAVVLLAAPFVGEGGWPSDEIGDMTDLGDRLAFDAPIHLFHGDADETAPISHLALYAKAIPMAVVHRLPGRDHQLNDDVSEVAAVLRKPSA